MTALPTRLLSFSGSYPYGTPGEPPFEQALNVPAGTKLTVELVRTTFYRDPDSAADPPGRVVIEHSVTASADDTGTWTWALTPSSYLTDNQRWRISLPGDPLSPRYFWMPDADTDLFELLDPAVVPPIVPAGGVVFTVGPSPPTGPSEGDAWLDTALDPPVLRVYDGARWKTTGAQGRTVFARSAPATGDDGDWWIDISTLPWSAHIRNTGAWHLVSGPGDVAGLAAQLQVIRNEIAALDAFEDAFIVQSALGVEQVTVAAAQAQDATSIDLPAVGIGARLKVAAVIGGRSYEHAFSVSALAALPDAGNDPLSDNAENPPAAANALRYQWDPDDSDSSLFVGHRSGKLVFSMAETGQIAWTLTDIRIRVVLSFSDLGDTPPGTVPGSRNIETDAAGNLTYGELISAVTQLDGFPSAITDGRPFVGGPNNTVVQGDAGSGGGAAKFVDHPDTPSVIPPGQQVLASTAAGGHLQFIGPAITSTPQRLSALPSAPQAGQWWVAEQDIASQLGADTAVREDQTRNGAQEIVAAPPEVTPAETGQISVDTGIDGAVDLQIKAADWARLRTLDDFPDTTGPPQNTPITTLPADDRIEFPVRNYDGVILNTLLIGKRRNRIWFAFQTAIGAATTVKFLTGLQATAGRHYVYIDDGWEDFLHFIGALRTDAEKAAITATVIPSALQAHSADRFPNAKLYRVMTLAEFNAADDQTGLIFTPSS